MAGEGGGEANAAGGGLGCNYVISESRGREMREGEGGGRGTLGQGNVTANSEGRKGRMGHGEGGRVGIKEGGREESEGCILPQKGKHKGKRKTQKKR